MSNSFILLSCYWRREAECFGIEQPPSGATVLILDIIIFLVQLVTVYVAYLCDPLPISTTTLTVLLPPVEISEDPLLPRAHENNEGDGEVQVWTVRRRRSQWKGKGKAGGIYRNRSDHGEEGVVDLNEDDVENERSSCEHKVVDEPWEKPCLTLGAFCLGCDTHTVLRTGEKAFIYIA